MKIANSIKLFQFRMNLRKTLSKEPYDLLIITKKELDAEFKRRAKRSKKK